MEGFWVAGGQEADTKGSKLIKTGHQIFFVSCLLKGTGSLDIIQIL